jgi:hypothetical protein
MWEVFSFPVTVMFMLLYLALTIWVPLEFTLFAIIFLGMIIVYSLVYTDFDDERVYYGILVWIWITAIVGIGAYKYQTYKPINRIIHVFSQPECTFIEKASSNNSDIEVIIVKNHKVVWTIVMSPEKFIEYKSYKGKIKVSIIETNTRWHQITSTKHIIEINKNAKKGK